GSSITTGTHHYRGTQHATNVNAIKKIKSTLAHYRVLKQQPHTQQPTPQTRASVKQLKQSYTPMNTKSNPTKPARLETAHKQQLYSL
ncbi:hypothetical protein, partial [Corynebacterium sp. NML130628]|uniref:hypothetical protein n=1 Tax=Corynebacterium sp. NML130628 TaxID=1906333 RepID=UPI001C4321ED